jgi:predicted nucleotide-binding protein
VVQAANHVVSSVQLGYRTGRRSFPVAPHEYDLMVCDLKKPACFDLTRWGPGGNNNQHCTIVDAVSDEVLRQGDEFRFKYQLIQESQLPSIMPGTFGPKDVLRAVKEAGVPFVLFLNDQWVKRVSSWFPNFLELVWEIKRTKATHIDVSSILSDRLLGYGTMLNISVPLQNAISAGPRPRHSHLPISLVPVPLIKNSVKEVFGQVATFGLGNIWVLPPFNDNGLVVNQIASNLESFKSAIADPSGSNRALEVPGAQELRTTDPVITSTNSRKRTVFVVHGRDERLRSGMFDFIRSLDLKPLEWTEAVGLTGKAAPYVGEILEAAFSHAQAVVVLFTPDDEAQLRVELRGTNELAHEIQLTPQARPNVLFEAGMAMASHPQQTLFVQFGEIRPFSDVGGRHMIRMDNSTKKRQDLAQRLEQAGCSVNQKGTDWQTAGDLNPPNILSSVSEPSTPTIQIPKVSGWVDANLSVDLEGGYYDLRKPNPSYTEVTLDFWLQLNIANRNNKSTTLSVVDLRVRGQNKFADTRVRFYPQSKPTASLVKELHFAAGQMLTTILNVIATTPNRDLEIYDTAVEVQITFRETFAGDLPPLFFSLPLKH